MKKLLAASALALSLFQLSAIEPNPYPLWNEGELEYHVICTGRGESIFMIMPDGTTMLIDAGDWYSLTDEMAPAMPDELYRSGEWIKRYILAVNPNKDDVDYLMVSHFHNDHTGDTTVPGLPKTKGKEENYVLCGITEVGQAIKFHTEFDRGYPDYLYPIPIKDPDVDNLRIFLKDQAKQHGLTQEKFIVGALNQIALTHNPAKYADNFSIRNYAASGEYWTGNGAETIKGYDLHPENFTDPENENTNSLAITVNYGPFRLYTGGDLTGRLKDKNRNWFNVENAVGRVVGNVDVAKLNHHGYRGSTSEEYVKSLDARTYLIPAWDYWHIQPTIMSNIEKGGRYNGEPMVFPTNIFYNHKKEFGDKSWFKLLSPDFGHIVVKVAPGGETYKVYVIDATDEAMNVKAVYGPYESGKHTK